MLEKLKTGEPLSAKEKDIHEQGLVSVLKSLHDEIDRAVLEAYGWSDLLPLLEIVNGNVAGGRPPAEIPMTREDAKRLLDETLLDRLVALNAERAAEEKRGLIRWLRPEFQNPQGAEPAVQTEIESTEETAAVTAVTAAVAKQPWPKDLTEQIKAVAAVLAETRGASVRGRDRRALHRSRPLARAPAQDPRHARRPRARRNARGALPGATLSRPGPFPRPAGGRRPKCRRNAK